MIWLSALWGRVWPYLAAAGAIVVGLFAVRQSSKAAGRQEAQAKQNEETIKAMEAAREAHAEIDALDDDAVRDRARQRCAAPKGGSYCKIAQRPFEWRDDAEISATPVRPLRWIEAEAETWARVCAG